MPLADFVQGPGRTALAEDELLTSIECDALAGYGGAFEKVGHRRSLVISTVCLAALLKLDASGRTIVDVRLGIAGIAPTPQRLRDVETALRGAPIAAETFERAADMPLPLIASRSRREYRREVVRAFMMRGLINAVKRAGADAAVLPDDLEAAYA
jgi:CO/xanthine dehydrogenase FAD-binding subunit